MQNTADSKRTTSQNTRIMFAADNGQGSLTYEGETGKWFASITFTPMAADSPEHAEHLMCARLASMVAHLDATRVERDPGIMTRMQHYTDGSSAKMDPVPAPVPPAAVLDAGTPVGAAPAPGPVASPVAVIGGVPTKADQSANPSAQDGARVFVDTGHAPVAPAAVNALGHPVTK